MLLWWKMRGPTFPTVFLNQSYRSTTNVLFRLSTVGDNHGCFGEVAIKRTY